MATRLRRRPRYIRGGRNDNRGLLLVFLLLAVSVTSIILLNTRLSPIVKRMANTRVTYVASKIINDAINEQILKKNIKYDELIHLEKDAEGRITALKSNMSEANRLKTEILTIILDKIAKADSTELSIPMGNLMPTEVFAGRGPLIPIKMVPLGSSSVTFENVFTSAGINQTRHQIVMNVTIYLSVILPGASTSTEVNSQIYVAETIIIGNVPGNYTYFENTSSAEEAAEKFFLYGDK